MSVVHRYPNGETERRYTRSEARVVFAVRLLVVVVVLPFLLVTKAVVRDLKVTMSDFQPRAIRLVGGEFYP